MNELIQIQQNTGLSADALTGKQYWRSLNQLAGTKQFREWVENEFPSQSEAMLSGASRRNVLKLMAASFGLAGLTACRRPVEHILPTARNVEGYIPGRPEFYATAMTLGGVAQGLLVEVNDGRPTKIEGNPDHPFSLGGTNSFHQASVLSLYDPDRMRGPMNGGKQVGWDVFDNWLASTFDRAKLGTGGSLRVLSERVNSPSLDAVRQHFLATFPGARWVEYDALESAGQQAALGANVRVLPNFERADIVVSLDCDFLHSDAGGTVLPMKQFSRRRRVGVDDKTGTMSRLYSVEARFSVTGSAADHRLRLKPSEVEQFAADLAGRIGAGGNQLQVHGQGGGDKRSRFLGAVVKDLNASRGRCLIVAGPRQTARVHALVHQMNAALGNVGQTVTYVQLPGTPRPQLQGIQELAGEMARGAVSHLVIFGGNPLFTAPAELALAANLKKVANTLYVGHEFDETAAAATWAIPETHYLEAWADATAPDGTATIQQPVIQPLFGGRTYAEVAAKLSGYRDQRAYDIVRNFWIVKFGGTASPGEAEARLAAGTHPSVTDPRPAATPAEKAWRKALHDGFVANTAYPTATPALNPAALQAASTARGNGGIEVVLVPDASVYDGRFANNAWLQELPDPMTKLTWDNAALVSFATAQKLGVGVGDVLEIEWRGRRVEAPAMIQPGQADDVVVLPLGYGRTSVGRAGKGAGFNAYPLRTSGSTEYAAGAQVRRTGRKYPLALTEEHHVIEDQRGRDEVKHRANTLVREKTIDEYRKHPESIAHMVHVPEDLIDLQLYHTPADYTKGNQWGMAIDLNVCTGCNACVVACQAENNVAVVGKEQVAKGREMHWLRLDRYYKGDENEPEAVSQPVLCMHCETAPCENVCPVAATAHSPEGLNDMAYNRCVGTRYCSNNCPYKVRRFNYLDFTYDTPEPATMVYNPEVTVRMRGVMEKCTYCVQRIQNAKIDAKTKRNAGGWLEDGEVTTACAQACPAEAIVFGNINDPESRVGKLKRLPRNYGMLEELNTRPRTSYLAKLRNPHPDLADTNTATEAHHG